MENGYIAYSDRGIAIDAPIRFVNVSEFPEVDSTEINLTGKEASKLFANNALVVLHAKYSTTDMYYFLVETDQDGTRFKFISPLSSRQLYFRAKNGNDKNLVLSYRA